MRILKTVFQTFKNFKVSENNNVMLVISRICFIADLGDLSPTRVCEQQLTKSIEKYYNELKYHIKL